MNNFENNHLIVLEDATGDPKLNGILVTEKTYQHLKGNGLNNFLIPKITTSIFNKVRGRQQKPDFIIIEQGSNKTSDTGDVGSPQEFFKQWLDDVISTIPGGVVLGTIIDSHEDRYNLDISSTYDNKEQLHNEMQVRILEAIENLLQN